MIVGDLIIGKVSAKRQVEFVCAKNLRKLQALLKKGHLDEAAEAEMIEHPEGLEDFITAYLQKYKAFVKDNNNLFVQKQCRHAVLFPVFCKVFDYSLLGRKAGCEVMMSLVKQAGIYPDAAQRIWPLVEAYFKKYDSADQDTEACFLQPENRGALIQFLKQGGRFQHHENEFRFLMGYVNYPQQVGEYLKRFGKKLVLMSAERDKLVDYHINQKVWRFLGEWLENSDSRGLIFDSVEGYVGMMVHYPQYFERYEVSKEIEAEKVEAEFLQPENRGALIQFLKSGGKFQHHENEFRFLMGYVNYPQLVEKYLKHFGKKLVLMSAERDKLVDYHIDQKVWRFLGEWLENSDSLGLIFDSVEGYVGMMVHYPQYFERYEVSKEIEACFFAAENQKVLFQFLKQGGRFQHHENEFRFLMMNNLYPQEVSDYLEKFGKVLRLTDKEQRQFISQNPNAVRCVNISSPVLFRDFVLPEIRRQRLPILKDDLSQLIQLSWDFPDFLRDYLKKYGYLQPRWEAELFFCADKQIRLEYGKKFGFDLENLVDQALKFGVASEIVARMKEEIAFVRKDVPIAFAPRFNLTWIKSSYETFASNGHGDMCILCHQLRGFSYGAQLCVDNERFFVKRTEVPYYHRHENSFCGYWGCLRRKKSDRDECSRRKALVASLRLVQKMLENAAERHYLTV